MSDPGKGATVSHWTELHRSGAWALVKTGDLTVMHRDGGYWTENCFGSPDYSFARHIAKKPWDGFSDFLIVWLYAIEAAESRPTWLTAEWVAREVREAITEHTAKSKAREARGPSDGRLRIFRASDFEPI